MNRNFLRALSLVLLFSLASQSVVLAMDNGKSEEKTELKKDSKLEDLKNQLEEAKKGKDPVTIKKLEEEIKKLEAPQDSFVTRAWNTTKETTQKVVDPLYYTGSANEFAARGTWQKWAVRGGIFAVVGAFIGLAASHPFIKSNAAAAAKAVGLTSDEVRAEDLEQEEDAELC